MLLFAILQFINVILGSLRSLSTAKSNRNIAMIFNVLSYTFYAAIVKLTNGQEMWYVLTITIITNLIGYYLADYLFCKAQKDKIWKITLEPLNEKVLEKVKYELIYHCVPYTEIMVNNGLILLEVYSYSQKNSLVIKRVLLKHFETMPKYFISENMKSL